LVVAASFSGALVETWNATDRKKKEKRKTKFLAEKFLLHLIQLQLSVR